MNAHDPSRGTLQTVIVLHAYRGCVDCYRNQSCFPALLVLNARKAKLKLTIFSFGEVVAHNKSLQLQKYAPSLQRVLDFRTEL